VNPLIGGGSRALREGGLSSVRLGWTAGSRGAIGARLCTGKRGILNRAVTRAIINHKSVSRRSMWTEHGGNTGHNAVAHADSRLRGKKRKPSLQQGILEVVRRFGAVGDVQPDDDRRRLARLKTSGRLLVRGWARGLLLLTWQPEGLTRVIAG